MSAPARSTARVYGKPQEKLEVIRPEDEFDLSKLSLEEIREMKNRILSEHPELAEFGHGATSPSPSTASRARVL